MRYEFFPVELDDECREYLCDYEESYGHWFYRDGRRVRNYDGRELATFAAKWKHRNPIIERSGLVEVVR